jgi:MFS transporter, putative metabolite:H+ symporter
MSNSLLSKLKSPTALLIIVASLGYFVDIYDLILFNIVKKPSLRALGITDALELENTGILLFNVQMIGMLCGGLLWGILGDKVGRLKVLFGSIILYSIGNIANGFVTSVQMYAIIRFFTGIGLAGELGAGITLISETLSKEKRGYGTMIVVTFGALGAVLAALIADKFDWKIAYFTGGILGLALLLLRVGTMESKMFKVVESKEVEKGNFFMLFRNRKTFLKYVASIFIGLPIWYIVGVLIALSETFSEHIGVLEPIKVSTAIAMSYLGLSAGDLVSGVLSQLLRSRKRVIFIFLCTSIVVIGCYLFSKNISVTVFYFLCFMLGFSTGFWALFVSMASEQFGTNIRSTVTNTVPNFVRGSVVPITLSFKWLKLNYGILEAALVVGSVCLLLSFISTFYVKETFAKELDYIEK